MEASNQVTGQEIKMRIFREKTPTSSNNLGSIYTLHKPRKTLELSHE